MRQKHREWVAGYTFSLPCIIGFLLFYAGPFIISLYYCFTRGVGGNEFVGFDNFKSLLESGSFLMAAKNTLIFNAISIPAIMVVSLLFALLLNRKTKGISFFRASFMLPLVVPVASVILVWQILFNEYGIVNGVMAQFGAQPVEWLDSGWSVVVLMMIYVWKNCGYNIILFLAGLNSIPKDYYEAANIDGAGGFTCFRKITLPYLAPTTFFVFIISIINSFKVFREAYLLAGGYPNFSIYMLQHFMNNNFNNLNYQRLSTAAFLTAIIIFLLVFIMFKMEGRLGKEIQH